MPSWDRVPRNPLAPSGLIPDHGGFNLGVLDSLLAATALRHGLAAVTRNTTDFPPDVITINPWLV